MLRVATCRRLRPSQRLSWRSFHTSRRLHSEYEWNEAIEKIAGEAYEFHHLFQHFHELTGFSYLVTIPVVTVLVRSLVTPFRYHLALRRRQQIDVIPQLQCAASIITKQAEQRTAAGVESKAQTDAWKQKRWEQKLQELMETHPWAKPTILMKPNSRFDAANIGASLLVIVNTSTILSQSLSDPTILGVVMSDPTMYFLSIGFGFLVAENNHYYRTDITPREDATQRNSTPSFHPFAWSDSEKHYLSMILIPLTPMAFFVFSPPAVGISLLSNSIYTFLERKCISLVIPTSKKATPDGPIEPETEQDLEAADKEFDSPDSKSPP